MPSKGSENSDGDPFCRALICICQLFTFREVVMELLLPQQSSDEEANMSKNDPQVRDQRDLLVNSG